VSSELFLLFCLQGAVGILLLLPLVDIELVGRAFFKINVRIAVVALLLGHGLCVRWADPLQIVSLASGGLAAAVALLYLRRLERADFVEAWPLRLGAGLAALASLLAAAAWLARDQARSGGWDLLALPSALLGAGLMGAVTLSMILGHYYLNFPKLSIEPLRRYNLALLVASSLRAGLFCGVLIAIYALDVPGPSPDRSFFLEHGLVLCQRFLFGVLGPCLLAYMSWETVKIHSTQSATGILYAAMVLVTVGELTAVWFQVSEGLCL
jgi:hypothetical protein